MAIVVHERKVVYNTNGSIKTVALSGSNCIGYESQGGAEQESRSRAVIFQFTVNSICSGLQINIGVKKQGGSNDLNIYGKLFQCSSDVETSINNAVKSVVGTQNGTFLYTIPKEDTAYNKDYYLQAVMRDTFILYPNTNYLLVLFSDQLTNYACAIYGENYQTIFTEYQGDFIKIYANGKWNNAIPYVYNNGWKIAIPYIYKDGWKRCDP